MRLDVTLKDNTIEFHDTRSKIDYVLKQFSQRLKTNDSLVDALIEERRQEARNEAR